MQSANVQYMTTVSLCLLNQGNHPVVKTTNNILFFAVIYVYLCCICVLYCRCL